jgi:hypothetical protein
VTARTQTAIADVQELLYLLQTQSDALSALDEPQSLDGIVLEGAVAGCGAIPGEGVPRARSSGSCRPSGQPGRRASRRSESWRQGKPRSRLQMSQSCPSKA